jgi:hypothetical protein
MMDRERVKFTASVPFERFAQLQELVEQRKRWSKSANQAVQNNLLHYLEVLQKTA